MKHSSLGSALRFIGAAFATVASSVPVSMFLWISLHKIDFPFLVVYFFPFLVAVDASMPDATGRSAALFDPRFAVAATLAEWAVACIAYIVWSQRAPMEKRTWTSAIIATLILLGFNFIWMRAFDVSLPAGHLHV
jgi:hypothetical protein